MRNNAGMGWTQMARVAWRLIFLPFIFMTLHAGALKAQLPEPGHATSGTAAQMLNNPLISPGNAVLYELEENFAKDAAVRGGLAFIDRMAPDGVLLMNGQAPIEGLDKIKKAMQWTPKEYQLTWTPMAAVMGPSGDMGYTWGHFEGRSIDVNGYPVVTKGRYMTIWRKEANGDWKIVLDAGANEPADAADCCRLPKP